MHGLPITIRCPDRNAPISWLTFAATPRSTTFRCARRNRRDPIPFQPFVRLPCSARKAVTSSGAQYSPRCGRSNGISREALADDTKRAYANGIFGVPTFVCNNEIFFGNDRLDMLGWRLGHENARA